MKLRIAVTTLALVALGARALPQGALASLEAETRKLTARVAPAIVRIEAGQERSVQLRPEYRLTIPTAWRESRVGTGFIVVGADKPRILTSHTVVADAARVTVSFADRTQVPARVIASDAYFRVAVLEAVVPETARSLELGEGQPVRGSFSLLFGNAHDQGPSLVLGLVCGVGRPHFGFDNFTVVSTPLTPGDSGAPIVGSDGRVQGMASAALSGRSLSIGRIRGSGPTLSLRSSSASGQSTLACSVPAADLRRVLGEVETHGRVRTAWLGVTLAEDGPDVRIVVSKSPAAAAGVRTGDRILALGDRRIESRSALAGALARTDPGTDVKLRVKRDGVEQDLEVRLVPRSERESGDLIEVEGGVQILVVSPRSSAARLPLMAGDVIIAVDGRPVSSAEGVREALSRFESERRIDLRVLRGDVRFHIDYRAR